MGKSLPARLPPGFLPSRHPGPSASEHYMVSFHLFLQISTCHSLCQAPFPPKHLEDYPPISHGACSHLIVDCVIFQGVGVGVLYCPSPGVEADVMSSLLLIQAKAEELP